MRPAACLIAIALVATPATAQTLNGILPPVKYDHPFTGELTLVAAKDQADVRALCPYAKFPPIGALGCAERHPDGTRCRVVLAPDADIIAAGYTTEIVRRHEIGHCNGWIGHEGARAYEEWAVTETGPIIPFTLDKMLFGR